GPLVAEVAEVLEAGRPDHDGHTTDQEHQKSVVRGATRPAPRKWLGAPTPTPRGGPIPARSTPARRGVSASAPRRGGGQGPPTSRVPLRSCMRGPPPFPGDLTCSRRGDHPDGDSPPSSRTRFGGPTAPIARR